MNEKTISLKKNNKIEWGKYFTFIIIVFVYIGIFIYFKNLFLDKKNNYIHYKTDSLKISYDLIIDSYLRTSKILFNEVVNKKEVLDILETANSRDVKTVNNARENLLKKLSPVYQRLKKRGIRQFHFHLPNNRSFLRFHKPSTFGDDLTDIRYSIKVVNSELKTLIGFEEGPYKNDFRYVFPIITVDKKHLGSVEISMEFSAVENQLKRLFKKEYEFLISKSIINEKLFKSENFNYETSCISELFMYEKNIKGLGTSGHNCQINDELKREISDKLLNYKPFGIFIKDSTECKFVTFIPLKNIEKKNIGYIISYELDDTINKIELEFLITLIVAYILVSIIVISLLLLERKNKKYAIEKENAELAKKNAEVAQEDAELAKENAEVAQEDAELAKENAEQAEKKADNANKVKSEFLANMSHELRTPLNGITLPCQILKKMGLTEEQNSFVDKISISTNRLLNIVNKVLDLSKIEKGELVLEETEFCLSKIINNISLMYVDQMKQKNLSFELINKVPEKTMFKADANQLQQVIINLINNAIKFTRKGSITLTIDYKEIENIDCLYCSVKDTGIGIKEENLNKLFKNFSQADSSITKEFGGTGLGLAISKKIINTMSGNISFESEFGVGTTFSFHFPIQKLNKLDEPAVLIRSEFIKFKDIKVLLVEDDFINQDLLLYLLKERDCIIDIADNGLQAIEKIKENEYDIVLMDIQMPVMDGETAVREIRKIEMYKKLPVIALTANAIKGDREKYLLAGMSDYITKPIDEDELIEVISKHLSSDLIIIGKNIEKENTLKHKEYPGFDNDVIKKVYSNKAEIFKEIHKNFIETYKNIYLDIKSLYEENSKEELLLLIHKFKGTSGMLKANKIHLITKELESILKENKDGFEDKLVEFKEEWDLIIK